MSRTQPPIDAKLLRFAGELADASGAIIKQFFRRKFDVEFKADTSPVSTADRAAEAEIRRLIGQHYPAHGVIGEEYGADRPEAEFVWVLDPIDGTKSFIAGRPLFGTLIALMREARPAAGVIDHPAVGERWIGGAGHPTTHDGRPVRTRACGDLSAAAMFASSPYYFLGDAGPRFDRVRTQVRQILFSNDCYAYGLIASGFGDLMVDAKMSIYDYLAAVPVIEGAGGRMTDWDGKPMTLKSGDRVLAAGDPRLHEQAMRLLNG
jgi:inositol-phosphate phosphatase/L-galactose 1-phosphate phosphatase/histidinol-phosphatase